MSEEKRRFRLGLFVISGIVLAGAGEIGRAHV